MQRRRPHKAMRCARTQVLFERIEIDEHAAHAHVRVDAQIEAAAVGRPPLRRHLEPRKTLVRKADVEGGRLGDDGRVRVVAGHEVLGSQARVLLVGDRRQQDFSAMRAPRLGQRLDCAHHRREAAFHIEGAAAVEPAVTNLARERFVHPPDVHRVRMGIEHERPAGTRAPQPGHNAHPARLRLVVVDLGANRLHRRADVLRDLPLARRRRVERRVDGVDADQVAQGGAKIGFVNGQHGLASRGRTYYAHGLQNHTGIGTRDSGFGVRDSGFETDTNQAGGVSR